MAKIKDELANSHWRETLSGCRVEEGWTVLVKKLEKTIDKNVPKSNHRSKLRNPWMTREILRLI
jgi:hypothetical protein